ncbi:MbtH family protein [Microbulbifer litoralis]|uniref:MbtH family protein n=1 Tax=Microbulbifer litoralis TaxID=2933965 RepID=UPI002028B053|nr:MbtH family protein [Microbulbifer sp. GX H0434]
MTTDNYTNPFDSDEHPFRVLLNGAGQYSLWPDFAAVPAGWQAVHGPAARAECLDYVERHWQSINPFAGVEVKQ